MDWNKSNTILIIAFLIVNIFLFSYTYYGDNFQDKKSTAEYQSYLDEIEKMLDKKAIKIGIDIPRKAIIAPFLEIEYNIIYPSKTLVEKYLGRYSSDIKIDTLCYSQDNKTIEIVGGKKIIFTQQLPMDAEINNNKSVDNIISEFCEEKDIKLTGLELENIYEYEDYKLARYVQMYNGYKLENSYVNFYIRDGYIYKLELQKAMNINERGHVKSISAVDALPRLMIYDDIKNKSIKNMDICYYVNEDDEFMQSNYINVDLVWKITFDDYTTIYLDSVDNKLK